MYSPQNSDVCLKDRDNDVIIKTDIVDDKPYSILKFVQLSKNLENTNSKYMRFVHPSRF